MGNVVYFPMDFCGNILRPYHVAAAAAAAATSAAPPTHSLSHSHNISINWEQLIHHHYDFLTLFPLLTFSFFSVYFVGCCC